MTKTLSKDFMGGLRQVEVKSYRREDYTTKVEIVRGFLHTFSQDFQELENGVGSYPIAIVELWDGTIITPHATNVKFI